LRFHDKPKEWLPHLPGCPAMDSRDLTPDQLIRIRDALGTHLVTLQGIARALERRVPGMPVVKAAEDAYGSLRDLWVVTHYLSCASGVGRPARTATTSGAFAAWAG
jgi:hypothetical protein